MAAETIDRTPSAAADDDQPESKNPLGRALDIAGICAGVILGVILFDILSGGKLTRWARNRRGPGEQGKPCDGCDDD